MIKKNILIVNKLGLHARAAAKLVRCAAKFKSRILLYDRENNATANAKSILSVLALAAPFRSKLTITADGVDEQWALRAVTDLFAAGFGEI